MTKSRVTPEEKLLAIIEKPGENKKYTKAFTRKQKQQFFIQRLLDFISFKWIDKDNFLSLRAINIFLVGIGLIITIFLIYGFISQKATLNKKYLRISQPLPQEECAQDGAKEDGLDLRDAVGEAKRRNIFTLTPEVKQEEAKKRQKPLTALKLVGILWSEDNPQAMIEDNEDKKTHILSVGDEIDRWKVKRITRSEVVLTDDEGEWELK
jgi:type II secretory pathway component PulC